MQGCLALAGHPCNLVRNSYKKRRSPLLRPRRHPCNVLCRGVTGVINCRKNYEFVLTLKKLRVKAHPCNDSCRGCNEYCRGIAFGGIRDVYTFRIV